MTKITIHHDQNIIIENAKIIRITNHITCYENLNLENKKLEEILYILYSIPGNPKIRLNYKVNYINGCRESIYWATMNKQELIESLEYGFDRDVIKLELDLNSWR